MDSVPKPGGGTYCLVEVLVGEDVAFLLDGDESFLVLEAPEGKRLPAFRRREHAESFAGGPLARGGFYDLRTSRDADAVTLVNEALHAATGRSPLDERATEEEWQTAVDALVASLWWL